MVKKTKEFLLKKFDAGVKSGQKADPVQVSSEMKYAKDNSGYLLFKPEEWRTAQQISSFFSRLSALQRKKQITDGQAVDCMEDLPDEDADAWEVEMAHEQIRNTVLNEISNWGPIGAIDVCELARADKLKKLKVSELSEICRALGLDVQGSNKRKKPCIDLLQAYVRRCSCST